MQRNRSTFRLSLFVIVLMLLIAVFGATASGASAQDYATARPLTTDPTAAPIVIIPIIADTPDIAPTATTIETPTPDATIVYVSPTPLDGVDSGSFTAIVIAGAGIILGLIGAYAYTQGKTIAALYESMPTALIGIIGTGLEFAHNRAAATASPLDDAALLYFTNTLGYTLERRENGRIILDPPAPKPNPPPNP